jgi:AhpD family alkylhydroperoxidase
MARIPAVPDSEAGVVGRAAYRYLRRTFGDLPEPASVLRNHRKLFWTRSSSEMLGRRAARTLPARLRELVIYRTATVVGCSWCVDFGAMQQRLSGLDVDRLEHIGEYETSPFFDRVDRLVIAYADAMTAQPIAVTDEQVAELAAELGRAGLVELTDQIALENMRARFNAALGIHAQGFDIACKVRLDRTGAPAGKG